MREQGKVVDAVKICNIPIAVTVVVRNNRIQTFLFGYSRITLVVWPIVEKSITIIDRNIGEGIGVSDDDWLVVC